MGNNPCTLTFLGQDECSSCHCRLGNGISGTEKAEKPREMVLMHTTGEGRFCSLHCAVCRGTLSVPDKLVEEIQW